MTGHAQRLDLPIIPGEGPHPPAGSCDVVLEFAAEAILALDEADRIVLFNRAAQGLFGYEAHEVLGRPIHLLVPDRFRARHARHLAAFRARGAPPGRMAEARVMSMLHRDGRELPVEVSISRVPSRGSVLLSAIVRDATARVEEESALRARLSSAQRLADALPIPVALVDRDHRFVFANRMAAAWLGEDPTLLAGTPVRTVLERVDSLGTWAISEEAMGRVLAGEEHRLGASARHADGSIRHVEIILAPSRNGTDEVIGYYLALLDLTAGAWGVPASDLLTAIELAVSSRKALRSRDRLFQKVTHDLGNPVASLVMVADRLLRGARTSGADERHIRLLESIATQSREMALIIEDLVAAANLRTGHAPMARRKVDAAAVAREALDLARPIAEFRGVTLEGDLHGDGLTALADPYHLRRAISALISESIAWSEPGDRVTVRTEGRGGGVDFEVRGPGSGVPDAELRSILDEARGASGSDLASWHAAGLALITGSELVRGHGAELQVETRDDRDRSYRFSLASH